MSAQPAVPVDFDRARVNRAMVGLLLALSLASLDGNIVGPALPRIVSDLGGLAHISWVVVAFSVASTATTPLYGRLSDQFGRKQAFFASIGIFLIGSMLCGFSRSMFELIGFRTLQGLGAGGLLTLTQTALADLIPPRERGRYQGFVTAVFVVCSVAGPLLGGLITDFLSWQWIFYINLPVGLIAVAIIARELPRGVPAAARRIDVAGFALLTGATCSFMLALSWGGSAYAWHSPVILGLLALTLSLACALVAVERAVVAPALPPRLFRLRVFSRGALCMFLSLASLAGATVFLPLYLQLVRGVSASEAGLRMAAVMGGIIVTSVLGGRYVSMTGKYRRLPVAGLALAACGHGLLAISIAQNWGGAWFEAVLGLLGLGYGLVMPNLTAAVQNGVRPRDLGVATATLAFFRSLGATFGVALAGMILTASLQARVPAGLSGGPGHSVLEQGIAHLKLLPPASRLAVSASYAHGLVMIFTACAGLALGACLIAAVLPEVRLRRRLTPP